MEEPLISIVMPALNAGATIGEAINSVVAQTWKHWELWVVDNGSTDDTAAIVRGIGDPRIHLLHHPVKGVGHARNAALKQINGEFYCFLDADDRLPDTSLADRARLLLRDRSVHFADGGILAFSADDPHVWLRTPTYRGSDPLSELLTIQGSCFLGPTWMIRRCAGPVPLLRTDMTHAEDLYYYMSIAHHGAYDFVPRPVLYYRVGHVSAMSDLDGLHQGYRQLVLAMSELPFPPDHTVVRRAWSRIRSIMCKSYLKAGRVGASLSACMEPLPARPSPKMES